MSRRSSPAVALLTLICLGCPVQATSIVILRSTDTIYVGADSRRTYRQPSQQQTSASSVCKIVPAGQLIFTAAGITSFNGGQVADIAAEAARKAPTAAIAMEAFRHRLTSFLPDVLLAETEAEPALDAGGNRLLLEAAYLGFEQEKAKVILEWFRQDRQGLLVSDRRTYDSPLPGRYDFIFAGKRRALDRFMADRSVTIRSDLDAISFITQAIGMEITDSPATTAPPIDIMQITANGRRWLQHKPGCEISSIR
jgi:hypothetical protein